MVNLNINLNPGNFTGARRSPITNANPAGRHWGIGPTTTPRLVLTGDTPDFDPTTIDLWKQEGFLLGYIPYDGDVKEYHQKILHLGDSLQLGDKFVIVAYGRAAAACLDLCFKPVSKLLALVAYYPSHLPKTNTDYPPSLLVQIHLAGTQENMHRANARNLRNFIYHYPLSEPGFAEYDLDEFDKVSSRLAFSRSLALLRNAFDMTPDLEIVRDTFAAREFEDRDADKVMDMMATDPHVNYVPTMTGGVGARDLHRFYQDHFLPGNPPDITLRLLSRTVGSDRVVDEMGVSFTHSLEMPWILPGIPPTGKRVELAMVSIVCIRGGKLCHEHIYWDQASVLVQVGLLDPKLVPDTFKTTEEGQEKEVKRLPVVGREGVLKVIDEEMVKSNQLIDSWRA